MNKLFCFIICVCLPLLIATSCINIKSDYPDCTYYKLTQIPPINQSVYNLSANKNVLIKEFEIGSEIETSKIVISESAIIIKKYNYHQWAATLNEMLTEFTITRFSKYNTFKKGISTSIYATNPDYVLECNILACNINNFANSNNVELSISVTLLTADRSTIEYNAIFSKTYTKLINRDNNSIEGAVIALSNAISQIDDEILIDIFNNVK